MELGATARVTGDQGTAVRLKLTNLLSPLMDQGFIEGTTQRHLQPLLDGRTHHFTA
jgi:hypothetical protein